MTFSPSFLPARFVVGLVPTLQAADHVLNELQALGSTQWQWSILAQETVLNTADSQGPIATMMADGSDIPLLPMNGVAAVGFIVDSLVSALLAVDNQTDWQALRQALQSYGLSDYEIAYDFNALSQGHILLLIQVPKSVEISDLNKLLATQAA